MTLYYLYQTENNYDEPKEEIIFKIDNNKYKILNKSNPNIKISIKKIIDENELEGKFLLYSLGYDNNSDKKIIIKCTYKIKKNFLFNKCSDKLFILLYNKDIQNINNMMIYKYNIHNKIYTYDKTFIQH